MNACCVSWNGLIDVLEGSGEKENCYWAIINSVYTLCHLKVSMQYNTHSSLHIASGLLCVSYCR